VYSGRKKAPAPYLDGNVVIRELDRILGPDSWSFEIEDAYDYEAQDRTDNGGQVFKQRMFYARGKLQIYQDGKLVVTRVDAGTNVAESDAAGTLEKAAKDAVTNALKRAALTLGPIFGRDLNEKGGRASGSRNAQAQRASRSAQARQSEEPQRSRPATNGTGRTGEVPFDPNPPRERSAPTAADTARQPAPAAQSGSANGASLPTDLEHIGALMLWATQNFAPINGDEVVRIARECGIPELAEVSAVSELHPFRNDKRLLSAIANSK
ncbi:MAG: Rad52/Rad22 family DNA repair protein, partial [Dehalococcoidia bacterium]|nr:Rad52/Rad22 family DNA repair protein [Dehalococcoidia bacterium]